MEHLEVRLSSVAVEWWDLEVNSSSYHLLLKLFIFLDKPVYDPSVNEPCGHLAVSYMIKDHFAF